MLRRNFMAALLAAPIAAVTAAKTKPQGLRELTREQQKKYYHAYNYGMSSDRFKELFRA
jgi:hypothetical protein